MENKGFTFAGVTGRMADLETKVGGTYYVALCWLAMTKGSGKNVKKTVRDKVFGTAKETSTFRNAWRIAEKSFPEGFHKGHREAAQTLNLDEAIKFAMECLQAHRVALEVTTMAAYEADCIYATKADKPEPEPEPENEPAKADKPEPEGAKGEDKDTPKQSNLELAMSYVEALTDDEAAIFEAWFKDRQETAKVMETEDQVMVKEAA